MKQIETAPKSSFHVLFFFSFSFLITLQPLLVQFAALFDSLRGQDLCFQKWVSVGLPRKKQSRGSLEAIWLKLKEPRTGTRIGTVQGPGPGPRTGTRDRDWDWDQGPGARTWTGTMAGGPWPRGEIGPMVPVPPGTTRRPTMFPIHATCRE